MVREFKIRVHVLKDIFYFEQVRCLDHDASVGQLVQARAENISLLYVCVWRETIMRKKKKKKRGIFQSLMHNMFYVVVQCICTCKIPFVLMKCRFRNRCVVAPHFIFYKTKFYSKPERYILLKALQLQLSLSSNPQYNFSIE